MTAFARVVGPGHPGRSVPVAIKVMRKDCTESACKEARIYAALDRSHPGSRHIIKLHETLFASGHACLVFEQHGITLSDWLRAHGPMPVEEVRLVAEQLLQALDALHSSGFAHGDIKPGNLLWDSETRQLRVIDLGWARQSFRVGQGIATRDYCPPEMLIGLPMTSAVDLWMTGCTLFELLTGECLFDPIASCKAKYKECNEEEEDENKDEDAAPAPAEELAAGDLLAGKYRLIEMLGEGTFGVVWSAVAVHHGPAATPLPDERECARIAAESSPDDDESTEDGYNIWQVVIGYEHFLQMQELLGPYPRHLANEGRFRNILYDDAGNFRFEPEITRKTFAQRLLPHLPSSSVRDWAALLEKMMNFDPAQRPTAVELLQAGLPDRVRA